MTPIKEIECLLLFIFLSFSSSCYSQGWGNPNAFSFLKNEKEICLKFNYDQLIVEDIWTIKGLWNLEKTRISKPEKEFLVAKTEELDGKGVGKGKLWVQNWELNKKNKFEPKFVKFFNKGTKHKLLGRRFVDSLKYTIQINLKEIRLGISCGYAVCNFDVLVYKTAQPEIILSKTIMYEVYGLKYSRQQYIPPFPKLMNFVGFISGTCPSSYKDRVKDCFAECGKDLGEEIRLSCYKKRPSAKRREPNFID